MKVQFVFDHRAVADRRANVLFAARFKVEETLPPRSVPTAFCLALDLEPGGDNTLFCETIERAHAFLRHLRSEDLLAIVTAGAEAETLFPLGPVADKAALHAILASLYPSRGQKRDAALALARAELQKAPQREGRLVECWRDRGLDTRAFVSAHIGGLQPLRIRDLRLRLGLLQFCEWAEPLGPHRDFCFPLPDGRVEYAIGDLVASEERNVFFSLHVPPLPQSSEGENITLIGEAIIDVEAEYELISPAGAERHLKGETIVARNCAAALATPTWFNSRP